MADPTRELQEVLKGHVTSTTGGVDELLEAGEVETLSGTTVPIAVEDGTMMVGGASVVCGNVPSSNGAVFVIDQVLLG